MSRHTSLRWISIRTLSLMSANEGKVMCLLFEKREDSSLLKSGVCPLSHEFLLSDWTNFWVSCKYDICLWFIDLGKYIFHVSHDVQSNVLTRWSNPWLNFTDTFVSTWVGTYDCCAGSATFWFTKLYCRLTMQAGTIVQKYDRSQLPYTSPWVSLPPVLNSKSELTYLCDLIHRMQCGQYGSKGGMVWSRMHRYYYNV